MTNGAIMMAELKKWWSPAKILKSSSQLQCRCYFEEAESLRLPLIVKVVQGNRTEKLTDLPRVLCIAPVFLSCRRVEVPVADVS